MFNIIILGIASFLTDVSTEMVYPLLPLYLTSARIGASPAIVGLIEGLAESSASLLRVFSGIWSDRLQQRKPLTIVGYACSLVGKYYLYISTTWPLVLVGLGLALLVRRGRAGLVAIVITALTLGTVGGAALASGKWLARWSHRLRGHLGQPAARDEFWCLLGARVDQPPAQLRAARSHHGQRIKLDAGRRLSR